MSFAQSQSRSSACSSPQLQSGMDVLSCFEAQVGNLGSQGGLLLPKWEKGLPAPSLAPGSAPGRTAADFLEPKATLLPCANPPAPGASQVDREGSRRRNKPRRNRGDLPRSCLSVWDRLLSHLDPHPALRLPWARPAELLTPCASSKAAGPAAPFWKGISKGGKKPLSTFSGGPSPPSVPAAPCKALRASPGPLVVLPQLLLEVLGDGLG